MKPITYLWLVALGIALGVAGYFAGKSGKEPSATPIQSNQPQTEQAKPNAHPPKKPAITPEAVTPESLAKAKNIPATLKNPQGDYTLVAVVEGADANRRFNQSRQVISAQRLRLDALSKQFNITPADLVQKRDSITGQINETKKTLGAHLRFMAKNYGYSLKNNYVKVTHEALLLSVTEEDGKAKTEKVYAFKTTGDYEDFRKKRDVYLRLKREQAVAAQAAKKNAPPAAVLVKEGSATPVPESDPVAEQDAKLKSTPEMDQKSKELQKIYKYDPEKNYQIRLEKTALYARAARLKTPAKAGSNLGKQAGDGPKSSQTTPPQTPQKRVITPEAIAKAKNVPATLKNPQGDYTLVAVVKGTNSNRRLNESLQIVRAQRQRLATLSQQFEKTPANYLQQRELIAGQINETRKGLEDNLRIMDQKYGYSLKNDYVKITHEASLLSVTEEDGKAGTVKKVYAFKNAGDYEDFQKKRDVYLRLKREQAKAAQAAKKNARSVANLKPTPEMDVKSKEMQQLYKYDPEKNYHISLEKTALYSRAAR